MECTVYTSFARGFSAEICKNTVMLFVYISILTANIVLTYFIELCYNGDEKRKV